MTTTDTNSPTPPQGEIEQLREKLAAIEHERWADWQKWVHQCGMRNENGDLVIDTHMVARWQKQINTPYEKLSEREQASDMEQVDRYWPLIAAQVHEAEARGRREGFHEGKQYAVNQLIDLGVLKRVPAALQDTTGEGE